MFPTRRHSLNTLSTSPQQLCAPQLSRFSIPRDDIIVRENIGEGAYGRVHVAKLHGCDVAVKFLHAAKTGEELDQRTKDKLHAEAHRLGQKRHENIVAFKGISNQLGCIVTEYCSNRSLYDVMRGEEYQYLFEDFTHRVKWLEQIAAAMICLHHEPPTTMHRDLKPSNLFCDSYFNVKVGDFGLASVVDVLDDFETFWPRSMESNLMMVYQPPEVIAGSMAKPRKMNYSTKSDVYSYGVLIRDLLTLTTHFGIEEGGPHVEVRLLGVMIAVRDGKMRPEVPEDRSELPGEFLPCLEPLVTLMQDCCERDPRRRPDFKTIHERISGIREDLRREMQSRETYQKCTQMSVIVTAAGCILVLAIALLACYASKDMIRSGGRFSPESTGACIVAGIIFAILSTALVYRGREWYKRAQKKKKMAMRQPLSEGGVRKQAKRRNGKQKIHVAKTRNPSPSPFFFAACQSRPFCPMASEKNELPENWMEICRRLVDELPASSTCENVQAVRDFCLQHLVSGQVTQQSWREDLVKYCSRSQVVMQTSAWKLYETAPSIPLDITIDIPPEVPPDVGMSASPPCVPLPAASSDPFAAGPSTPLAIPIKSPSLGTRTPDRMAIEMSEANSKADGVCVVNAEIGEMQGADMGRGVASSAASGECSCATVHFSMFRLASQDEATEGDDASRGFGFCPFNASTPSPNSED